MNLYQAKWRSRRKLYNFSPIWSMLISWIRDHESLIQIYFLYTVRSFLLYYKIILNYHTIKLNQQSIKNEHTKTKIAVQGRLRVTRYNLPNLRQWAKAQSKNITYPHYIELIV